jgi:hypothetical protein
VSDLEQNNYPRPNFDSLVTEIRFRKRLNGAFWGPGIVATAVFHCETQGQPNRGKKSRVVGRGTGPGLRT